MCSCDLKMMEQEVLSAARSATSATFDSFIEQLNRKPPRPYLVIPIVKDLIKVAYLPGRRSVARQLVRFLCHKLTGKDVAN